MFVVGPSGVGKDSLMDYAKAALANEPRIQFVRRVITRPPSTGEGHEPATAMEFAQRVHRGDFALHWEAHGLQYGVPVAVDKLLKNGTVVVCNGSRAALGCGT